MLTDNDLRRMRNECLRAKDDPDVDHRANVRLLLAENENLRTIIAMNYDPSDATTVDGAVVRLCLRWWQDHKAAAKGNR